MKYRIKQHQAAAKLNFDWLLNMFQKQPEKQRRTLQDELNNAYSLVVATANRFSEEASELGAEQGDIEALFRGFFLEIKKKAPTLYKDQRFIDIVEQYMNDAIMSQITPRIQDVQQAIDSVYDGLILLASTFDTIRKQTKAIMIKSAVKKQVYKSIIRNSSVKANNPKIDYAKVIPSLKQLDEYVFGTQELIEETLDELLDLQPIYDANISIEAPHRKFTDSVSDAYENALMVLQQEVQKATETYVRELTALMPKEAMVANYRTFTKHSKEWNVETDIKMRKDIKDSIQIENKLFDAIHQEYDDNKRNRLIKEYEKQKDISNKLKHDYIIYLEYGE